MHPSKCGIIPKVNQGHQRANVDLAISESSEETYVSICAKLLNKGILVPVVILFTALAIGCSDEPEETADINATVEARVAQRLGTQEALEASALLQLLHLSQLLH